MPHPRSPHHHLLDMSTQSAGIPSPKKPTENQDTPPPVISLTPTLRDSRGFFAPSVSECDSTTNQHRRTSFDSVFSSGSEGGHLDDSLSRIKSRLSSLHSATSVASYRRRSVGARLAAERNSISEEVNLLPKVMMSKPTPDTKTEDNMIQGCTPARSLPQRRRSEGMNISFPSEDKKVSERKDISSRDGSALLSFHRRCSAGGGVLSPDCTTISEEDSNTKTEDDETPHLYRTKGIIQKPFSYRQLGRPHRSSLTDDEDTPLSGDSRRLRGNSTCDSIELQRHQDSCERQPAVSNFNRLCFSPDTSPCHGDSGRKRPFCCVEKSPIENDTHRQFNSGLTLEIQAVCLGDEHRLKRRSNDLHPGPLILGESEADQTIMTVNEDLSICDNMSLATDSDAASDREDGTKLPAKPDTCCKKDGDAACKAGIMCELSVPLPYPREVSVPLPYPREVSVPLPCPLTSSPSHNKYQVEKERNVNSRIMNEVPALELCRHLGSPSDLTGHITGLRRVHSDSTVDSMEKSMERSVSDLDSSVHSLSLETQSSDHNCECPPGKTKKAVSKKSRRRSSSMCEPLQCSTSSADTTDSERSSGVSIKPARKLPTFEKLTRFMSLPSSRSSDHSPGTPGMDRLTFMVS